MNVTWILRRALPLLAPIWLSAQTDPQFTKLCAPCHASDATGTDRGPSLANSRSVRSRTDTEIHDIIRNGTQRGMPPFALPEAQLQSLTQYVRLLNPVNENPKHAGD